MFPRMTRMKFVFLMCLTSTLVLSGCGSNNNGSSSYQPLSGDWQFTMAPPTDGSFVGGLQGGFLLQSNGSSTTSGSVAYSISLPTTPPVVCNSGSAAITGTVTGFGVNFTATAGTQTFTLVGTLNSTGTTMSGTYTSTAGTAADGSPCGNAETGLAWYAVLVPPLTGSVQGTFYSGGGSAGLDEQDFLVSGALIQATNAGSSNSSLTGNLIFLNATSNSTDYPCFLQVTVSGQISGNTVSLQLLGSDGSIVGQIGTTTGSTADLSPVIVNTVAGGYVLSGPGPSYIVATGAPPATATNPCPGSLSTTSVAGDFGTVCLAGNGAASCTQPITLAPTALSFPAQTVGTTSSQAVTLTNSTKSNLSLTVALTSNSGLFTETDQCGAAGVPSNGEPFDLIPGQPCTIMISYAPACNSACPSSQTTTLAVTSLTDNMIFTLPISGAPKLYSGSNQILELTTLRSSVFTDQSEYFLNALRSLRGQDLEYYAEDH